MQISRTSPFTGKLHFMELNVSQVQLADWESGTLAQNAFPQLSAEDREFIMTGITPTEWDDLFGVGE